VSNPFRTALEGDSVAAAPDTAPTQVETAPPDPDAVSAFEAALAAAPDDDDSVSTEDDDGTDVVQAETIEKDGKKREVVAKETFLKRVGKLSAQKKTIAGERDTARAEVDRVKAQVQSIKPIIDVAARYKGKEAQLEWDVDFIDTLEQLAKTDPDLQSAAQRVIAGMKGKKATVQNTETPTTPTPTAPAAAPDPKQSELLIVTERVVNRDARRVLTETLEKSGVDEKFVKTITNAAMKELSVAQRAELDGEGVVAFTKKFLKSNELTASDIFKAVEPEPKKGAKPNVAGTQGKPAPAAKPAPKAETADNKPKTVEEYQARRSAGIRALAEQLNGA
jgi:hypothetical protein